MTIGATSRSEIHLGTVVTISVADAPGSSEAVARAFEWFRHVEARCSRFDPSSELMQLTQRSGTAIVASDVLFEAVRFAIELAACTAGAFDPTIGHVMEDRGFNREHRSGHVVRTAIAAPADVSYRDVECDADARTITLRRPLILDLGAVAKGLAIDMAARELRPFHNFGVDAGGDLYLGGTNPAGAPWAVGIRHPRIDGELIDVIHASDLAVCTSGDYERRSGTGHHIVDPRTGQAAASVASVTVVGPTAMLADAVATAAFVLGADEGLALCDALGLDALIITTNLDRRETPGLRRQ
ncbi:MAG TPA: FAD:protein FMN transferase [Vicinamibacterales bacterium]|nr:FAD:protein FMN transferase [Vicinamibacterales bacterium]